MPVSDHLSIPAPLSEKSPMEIASKRINWSFLESLRLPLPFSARHRNSLFLMLLAASVVCFWEPLANLYALTNQQDHYSHIVLIPWLTLYAFYVDRTTILSSREWSPLLGLGFIAVGALWAWQADVAIYGADLLSVQILAFVILCWGLFVLCYGVMALWTSSFGLLLLLCMVPLPANLLNAVIVFLQRSTTEATDVIFTLLGIPFYREGFIFGLPNISIHIAEECSGIRSTLSLIITSLVAGHFLLRSLWGKFALVLVVLPLAIIKNAFRIVGLSVLANYVDRTFITDSLLHKAGGIPLFGLALVILLVLAWLLRKIEKRTVYSLSDALHAKM